MLLFGRFLVGNSDGMADARDGFSLKCRGRGVQSTCGAEEDVVPSATFHGCQQISSEHRGATSTARASTLDVLLARVEDENATVAVVWG